MSTWDSAPAAEWEVLPPVAKQSHDVETSAALTQSMRHITDTKLAALAKRQESYIREKNRILQAVASGTSAREKVKILLDAFKQYKISIPSTVSAAINPQFLQQSLHDTSISSSLILEWQAALEEALETPSRKYMHASLFGRLVMEWLGDKDESSLASEDAQLDPQRSNAQLGESSGRKEMFNQRRDWDSIVFAEDPKPDPAVMEAHLESIFGDTTQAKKLFKTPLDILREAMGSFDLGALDVDSLKTCISGALNTDLLSEEKRKALAGFANNPMILQETVDVLNMQIDTLDSWSWGDDAVTVHVKRGLNGKYRVFMDEEILQALFLYYVGMKWAVHMKTAFLAFFHSGAWKQSSRQSMDRNARRRRQAFLGRGRGGHQHVRNERREKYQSEYFLSQLPSSFTTTVDNYAENPAPGDGQLKSPIESKQSLLRLLSTEAVMNTRVYGSFAILQSDFRWFGPAMPHATIMAVMRFFGVSDRWLQFFQKFLESPIKFAMDGPDAQTRIRRRGVPIQHRLSDAFGEAVLFCLDYAVNKSTEFNLYRLHDDVWFWGDRDATVKAWQTLQTFASTMGLHLNDSKTGAVELSGDPIVAKEFGPSDVLPSGPIVWGFLKMGSSGQWIIDDRLIDIHTKELKTQLAACKSIFAWVQAWNMYAARFLSNNLGTPANCLGRPHLDMVIDTFEKIQRWVFDADSLGGENAIGHLRTKLADRFGVKDIPDGFFVFPVELGGLGLLNPLIPLIGVHENSLVDPVNRIKEALDEEEAAYDRAKKNFEEGEPSLKDGDLPLEKDTFMSLEEFTRYREETSHSLCQAYKELMDVPEEKLIRNTPEITHAYGSMGAWNGSEYEYYDDWVLQLYGPEIIRKYGGLEMGEKKLLPIGLARMLRSEKVRWQN